MIGHNDIIRIPDTVKHTGRKLELAIHFVYFNDESFLNYVNRSVNPKLLSTLGTRKKGTYYDKKFLFQGIDDVLQHYNKSNIFISQIHSENEFRSIMEDLEENW